MVNPIINYLYNLRSTCDKIPYAYRSKVRFKSNVRTVPFVRSNYARHFYLPWYFRCPHSTRGRVYVTVGCPFVRLSVCPVDRQQQRRAAGLLLSAVACSRCRSTAGTRRTRSAANAGSVVSRAEERGSTQTYVLSCYLPVQFYTRSSTNNAMRTPDARVDFCWRDVLSWERNKTKVVVSRRLI